MKAAVLERRGVDGVSWRDFPDPMPATGESVLKVAAASVNRVDLYMRDNGSGITHVLPQVMGVEAAGTVVEAAPGSGLKPGMKAVLFSEAYCGRCRYCLAGNQPLCENVKIMGEHRHGGFADYIAMPSNCFFPLPEDADLVAAGALMTGHLTAWRMLFGKRALQPGESVLIVGIGGGVAVACLQLAKMVGARVLVTSSSDEKIARAMALGADGGVNYRRDRVSVAVQEMSGGGVDMVIDSRRGELGRIAPFAAPWRPARHLRRDDRIKSAGGSATRVHPPARNLRLNRWERRRVPPASRRLQSRPDQACDRYISCDGRYPVRPCAARVRRTVRQGVARGVAAALKRRRRVEGGRDAAPDRHILQAGSTGGMMSAPGSIFLIW